MAHFNSFFLINSCFTSSSINAKKKFWSVFHPLHMSVIFFSLIPYMGCSRKALVSRLCYAFTWISPKFDINRLDKYWYLIKFALGLWSEKVCILLNKHFERHLSFFFSGLKLTFQGCFAILALVFINSEKVCIRPKRKILLFPEMRVKRKIFTRPSANLSFFLLNLIEFFK